MSIAKTYDPKIAEDKWYKHWMEKGYFSSTPDEREPFTIVIPPPNVTGVLHMGHMLNNTIQDVLVRRARMQGLRPKRPERALSLSEEARRRLRQQA